MAHSDDFRMSAVRLRWRKRKSDATTLNHSASAFHAKNDVHNAPHFTELLRVPA